MEINEKLINKIYLTSDLSVKCFNECVYDLLKYLNAPWTKSDVPNIQVAFQISTLVWFVPQNLKRVTNNLYVENVNKRYSQLQPHVFTQVYVKLVTWIVHYLNLPFGLDLFEQILDITKDYIFTTIVFPCNKCYVWKINEYPSDYVCVINYLQNSIVILLYSIERLLPLNAHAALLHVLEYLQLTAATMTFPKFDCQRSRQDIFGVCIQIFCSLLNHVSGDKNFKNIKADRFLRDKQTYNSVLNCLCIWIKMLKTPLLQQNHLLKNIYPGVATLLTQHCLKSKCLQKNTILYLDHLLDLYGVKGVTICLDVISIICNSIFDQKNTLDTQILLKRILNKPNLDVKRSKSQDIEEILKRLDLIFKTNLDLSCNNAQIQKKLINLSLNILLHYPIEYLHTNQSSLCNLITKLIVQNEDLHPKLKILIPKPYLENLLSSVLNDLDPENLSFSTEVNLSNHFIILTKILALYSTYENKQPALQLIQSLSTLYSINYRFLIVNTQSTQMLPTDSLMNSDEIDNFMAKDEALTLPTNLADHISNDETIDFNYLNSSLLLSSYKSNVTMDLRNLSKVAMQCITPKDYLETTIELLEQSESEQTSFNVLAQTVFYLSEMMSSTCDIKLCSDFLAKLVVLDTPNSRYLKLLCVYETLQNIKFIMKSRKVDNTKEIDKQLRDTVFHILHEGYKCQNKVLLSATQATFNTLASCFLLIPNAKFENLISQTIDHLAYGLYTVDIQSMDLTQYLILYTCLKLNTTNDTILLMKDINAHLINHLRLFTALQHMCEPKYDKHTFLWCIKLLAVIAAKLASYVHFHQEISLKSLTQHEQEFNNLFNFIEIELTDVSLFEMAEAIFQESRKLLTNSDRSISYNAHLACLYSTYCFTVSQKALLPKIHQLWPTLVYSFKVNQGCTSNLVATIILKLLINISPKFVLPRLEGHLVQILFHQLKVPCTQKSDSDCTLRNQFYTLNILKTVYAQLKNKHAEFSIKTVHQTFGICFVYIDECVHQQLQTINLQLFSYLYKYDSQSTITLLSATLKVLSNFNKKFDKYYDLIGSKPEIATLTEAFNLLKDTGINSSTFIPKQKLNIILDLNKIDIYTDKYIKNISKLFDIMRL